MEVISFHFDVPFGHMPKRKWAVSTYDVPFAQGTR